METPSRYTFSPDGSTNVFQIPVQIKGDNYVRIDIDDVTINDRNKFDIVNNSIVFVNTADVPSGSKLDILVVQTDEGISNLGNVNAIDIVSQNILLVNAVGTDIAAVVNNSNNMTSIQAVDANMPAVVNAAQAAIDAAASEAAAKVSENASKASELAAKASENASKASENAASASETAAASSASSANTSLSNAVAAELSAIQASADASTSKNAAKVSETNAAISQAAAAASEAGVDADRIAAQAAASSALAYRADTEYARDQSLAARDTANLHRLAAQAAATSATNTASALTGFDLEAIAASKAVTAVDVFVYDTSKDSDGGAWRKRTQGTSWYNETLNTATRGSRREFPAVAVIVAEADKVTIYDGDDPDLPMWMEFNGGAGNMMAANSCSSVAMLNGRLTVGNFLYDVVSIDFAGDRAARAGVSTIFGPYLGNVLTRNSNSGWASNTASFFTNGPIVNRTVNDVAMVVLPDAPIDPATGLPVPTIAVATDGGVSVIKDDGTVVDLTYTRVNVSSLDVFFPEEGGIAWTGRVVGAETIYLYWEKSIPEADKSTAPDLEQGVFTQSPASFSPILRTVGSQGLRVANKKATGSTGGLTTISRNPQAPKSSMVAYTTSTYNTGWMNGDIKGAFLSDTDDTDLVGSGEIWSGTPDRIDANWTDNLDGTYTSNGSAGFIGFDSPAPLENGKAYVVEITVDSLTSGSVSLPYDGTGAVAKTSVGTYVDTFIADAGGAYGGVYVYSDNFSGTVSNVSVKLADADRSVNNNGLAINGTVTKTPVSSGADLVAYSGFSASNYLEQPYNSDLDFGTGDFCVMGWFNIASGLSGEIFRRTDPSFSGAYLRAYVSSNQVFVRTTGGLPITTNTDATGTWRNLAMVRRSGLLHLYLDGVDLGSTSDTANLDNSSATLILGNRQDTAGPFNGSLALFRISATAPTAEQIRKIYEDEKVLFQENAQATLYGSSDAVTALAHDDATDLLHVGTSAGRSVFQGLRRVSNTTTAVGTAISASNNLIVEE